MSVEEKEHEAPKLSWDSWAKHHQGAIVKSNSSDSLLRNSVRNSVRKIAACRLFPRRRRALWRRGFRGDVRRELDGIYEFVLGRKSRESQHHVDHGNRREQRCCPPGGALSERAFEGLSRYIFTICIYYIKSKCARIDRLYRLFLPRHDRVLILMSRRERR